MKALIAVKTIGHNPALIAIAWEFRIKKMVFEVHYGVPVPTVLKKLIHQTDCTCDRNRFSFSGVYSWIYPFAGGEL